MYFKSIVKLYEKHDINRWRAGWQIILGYPLDLKFSRCLHMRLRLSGKGIKRMRSFASKQAELYAGRRAWIIPCSNGYGRDVTSNQLGLSLVCLLTHGGQDTHMHVRLVRILRFYLYIATSATVFMRKTRHRCPYPPEPHESEKQIWLCNATLDIILNIWFVRDLSR